MRPIRACSLQRSRRAPLAAAAAAWLGIAAALGCSTARLHYAGPAPALPAVGEDQRAELIAALRSALKARRIAALEVVGDGPVQRIELRRDRANELAALDLPVLQAALWSARRGAPGAQIDLLARGAAPGGAVLSASNQLDGTLRIGAGVQPLLPQGAAPTSAELQQRYGIGPLLQGSAPWADAERRLLELALSLLSPGELACLAGLPFRRERGAERTEAGYYARRAGEERGAIALLDRAFASDEQLFVRGRERAYPGSLRVILHEIGHVLARLERERVLAARDAAVGQFNELAGSANESALALEAQYRELARIGRTHAQTPELLAQIEALEAQHAGRTARLDPLRRRVQELELRLQGPSALEQAYAALPGARGGPTPYGATNLSESFAEAFALAHLAPDALARVSPALRAWFDSGQHLAAGLGVPREDAAAAPAAAAPPAPASAAPEPEYPAPAPAQP